MSAPPTSSSKTPKEAKNVSSARASLAEHRMHFDNRKAYDLYPALKSEVAQILDSERNSTVSVRSIDGVKKYLRKNAVENEETLYPDLIAKVLPHTRTVPSNKRALDDTMKMIEESYDDLDLYRKKDPLFVKGLLPADMEKEEKVLGLTNPKPDYVWGKKKPDYPDDGPGEDIKALIGVCPGLLHPFFAIEKVAADKPIAQAENQCIRVGATIVNARRRLLLMAQSPGWTEIPGADLESFAFSCAWSPDRVILFMHWCEARQNKPPIFHMSLLHKYDLSDEDGAGFIKFRQHIHNILDWGVFTCAPIGEKAVEKIVEARAGKAQDGALAGPEGGGAQVEGAIGTGPGGAGAPSNV